MELKVWVDGIKRVVCGVTDQTSCQDIVIALAQAMGRTGRFTLIEKWRDNERPLAPGDFPLLVLQKWGEFANEVKFILYESGSRRKNKDKEKNVKKDENQFTHNFTPPVKTSEAVIRRSLTFSGIQKPETINHRKPEQNHVHRLLADKSSNKILSDGNSWSSSSSISSQNSTLMPPQFPPNSMVVPPAHRRVRSSSRERNQSRQGYSLRQPSPQPQHVNHSSNQGYPPNTYHSTSADPGRGQDGHYNGPDRGQNRHHEKPIPFNNQTNRQPPPYSAHKHSSGTPVLNGPSSKHSAFLPVGLHGGSAENKQDVQQVPDMDIPIYTKSIKSSRKSEMEEYDLDSNFPDVVRETGRDLLIEEYHVPGSQGEAVSHGNHMSWEEQERVKLLRLVTMQSERIKMQDTQLDIIDTEIGSREQKLEDMKVEIEKVTEEILTVSQVSEELDDEMATLDNGTLLDEIDHEKHVEKEIKVEITALRGRLEKCENDLHQFQSKVKLCSDDLEKETETLKIDEKRRKEEELKLQQEISELKKSVEERNSEIDNKATLCETEEFELKQLLEKVSQKSDELTNIEKDIQRENLKFFALPSAPDKKVEPSKSQQSNGEDGFYQHPGYRLYNIRPNTVRRNQSSRSWREANHRM